jgi:hypothetical protein
MFVLCALRRGEKGGLKSQLSCKARGEMAWPLAKRESRDPKFDDEVRTWLANCSSINLGSHHLLAKQVFSQFYFQRNWPRNAMYFFCMYF